MVVFSSLYSMSVESPMMTKSEWQLFLLSPSSTLYPFSLFMLYQQQQCFALTISIECKVNVVVCLVAKSSPTLCDPLDCSLPGSSVHGISQARILEWVGISFSRGSSLTQRSNPGLPLWQVDSLPLSHLGIPPRTISDT